MEVIKTTSYDQSEIIKSILKLHVPKKKIDLDPTYSKGNFYNNTGIEKPKYRYDIQPTDDSVSYADCRNLPLDNNSIDCIMFDPPFVIGSGKSCELDKDGQNIILKRFSNFKTPSELYNFYIESLREFYRILKPNGVLIFKCQDTVSSGVNYMSHIYIHDFAVDNGFYPKDLFILNAKNRIISGKHKNQQHARKYHSYFWVFEKDNAKIKKIRDFLNFQK